MDNLSKRINKVKVLRFEKQKDDIKSLDEMQKFISHLHKVRRKKEIRACRVI